MAEKEPEDFLATARNRFSAAAEDEKHLREKFISDLKFASPDGDDQWDPLLKMQREQAGRPAMAFPRCHTFVQQVSNEARQNKPQIKFAPRLDADKDTAEIYEGLARYIQYTSDAQIAYETAIEYSAGGSFGYYRFLTDYITDEGDELELKVCPVLDPLAVYGILVPTCFNRKPKWAFVVEDMPKEEFKEQYPNSEMASLSWVEAGQRCDRDWVAEHTVRIAEYWYCVETKVDGKRRPKCKVKFCKTNGLEVLEDSETDWPGSCIPIIPVLGKQMIMEGKPRLSPRCVRQKSAQQLLNYSKTRIAETLAQSPISPYMLVEGQIAAAMSSSGVQSIRAQCRTSHIRPSTSTASRRRRRKETRSSPRFRHCRPSSMQEIDDMKGDDRHIMMHRSAIRATETSGQAILKRQQQSNLATMHFMDNLERSFKKGGEVIAELIPKIYDTAREIQILGEDEAPKIIYRSTKQHQRRVGQAYSLRHDQRAVMSALSLLARPLGRSAWKPSTQCSRFWLHSRI